MSLVPRFLAVLALAAPVASHGATLGERAAAIDAPASGGELSLAGPFQIGRAEIVPAAGTRVRVLLAGGIPCGLVVEGPARLLYRVEDRFSAPVAKRNAGRVPGLRVTPAGQGLEMTADLTGAVIWGWQLAAASNTSDSAPSAGSGLPEWAAKLLADRRFQPPSHDLLAAEANGVEGVRYALLQGPKDDLLLSVDPGSGLERLDQLTRGRDPDTSFRGGVWLHKLVVQPSGRPWWSRPSVDLIAEHEHLAVENPSGELLRFVSRSRLRARRSGPTLWQAELVDRPYDERGRRRQVTVRSVRVDGRPADFLHRDGELLVQLGRKLADQETVEVEVSYDGDIAFRPAGHSYWLLGTWPWYPRQELEGELATIEISVDVPEPLTPFASGAQTGRTAQAGRHKLSTRLDHPMQFAVVLAGKYRFVEETHEGVTCRVATYAMVNESATRKAIARFFSARRFFEQLFDEPYPFQDVSIIEINDWGFGQAPPGVIFLTKEFFTAPVDQRTRGFFADRNARFLHEVAHGWWGNVVKMNAPEEAWLSEAFADYTAALAVWQLVGKERGTYALDEIVKDWVQGTGELDPEASLYLTEHRAVQDSGDFEDYLRLRYSKGPLVVHALRLELQRQKGGAAEGDRYFIALLRSFFKRYRFGWGTTRGLVETLDELTGGNWQPWFERYVYGTEVPKLPG